MTDSTSLLKELDELMSRGSEESRLRALWHATDVLIAGQYSEPDIWTFGEVIERLARGIELAARAELARRLAHSGNAPIGCVKQLANDASIDVAGPDSSAFHAARHRNPGFDCPFRKPATSSRYIEAGGHHRTGDRCPACHRQSGRAAFAGRQRRRAFLPVRLPANDRTIRTRFLPCGDVSANGSTYPGTSSCS